MYKGGLQVGEVRKFTLWFKMFKAASKNEAASGGVSI